MGVVGEAVRHYFEVERDTPVIAYDPYKRLGSVREIDAARLVFVCVPTPYRSGIGFDDSAISESLELLEGEKTVVVKSTVLPGSTESYQARFPQHTLLHNPEFLRERSALQDFLAPDRQLVGYCDGGETAARAVLDLLPRAPYAAVVPASTTEMVKYATNAFLALKVIFANELYDLSEQLGIDYDGVREGLAADARIGPSHLSVLDGGYRGYGGKCLPKDTLALMDLAEDAGAPLHLLEAAHDVNRRLRAASPLERRTIAEALLANARAA
jgi:UDPglucose 6-dehydrogenase